jgi:chromosome segregation ATPase
MKRSIWLVVVSIAIVVFISTRTPAQAPPTNDVNAALIRELHDLRLAIEKLAGAGSRIQMLTARISQQEQRISSLMNQLIPMNSKLAEASADMALKAAVAQELAENLRLVSDPKEREEIAARQKDLAWQLNQARSTQASVQAQADAIRQQLALEQSTLSDLQRRLDDLDRAMAEPHQ